ncbi:glutathione S-transferase family protein [Pyruvatibacter sp.]|uniref:glutathione S-transferase family protein n=1 Tax=Pyruvatibacter sp. TaxID=1981328 RepID=UPI0032EB61D8
MALIVYGAGPSPFVRKVRVFLAEKGADYQHKNVNIFPMPDWFKDMSPLKRIPVLQDTDRAEPNTIADSSAICAYAEHAFPEPSLYPADAWEHGRACWLEEYADTEMANAIGMGVFRPVALAALMGKEQDKAKAAETMNERMPAMFDYLTTQIGDNEYFAGGAFSIADIAVATQFVNLKYAGFTPDDAKWPALATYVDRIHARASFKVLIDADAPLFAATAVA